MSSFIERSAIEESDEEAKSQSGAASDSGSESESKSTIDSSEEEEEDEEGVVEDLINDEPIEEEEEPSDDSDAEVGKRKQRSDDDDQLEDEDFQLIEENLGIKVQRKKHKRIKVMSDDDESDGEKDANEAEMVANQIFGDDDAEDKGPDERTKSPGAAAVPAAGENMYGDLSESEESDPDDFIVGEDGQPISRGKKKRHVMHSDRALQEAQDVFGVDFDFAEFEEYGSDGGEEAEDESDYEDEGGDSERPVQKKRGRRGKKSIFEVFEPSELERGHMTDVDQEIRAADMPERFHLRTIKVTNADQQELSEEAEWIFTNAFAKPTISIQDSMKNDRNDSRVLIKKISSALDFLRNHQLEVPFINFYRKEYVQPELKINDLWKIWQWDEKWALLRNRKQNLVRLLERMQEYQYEMNKNPDILLAPHVRTITQEDIDRVKAAESTEEYWDTHNHFMLYYGKDLQAMKEAEKKRKKDKPLVKDKKTDQEKEEGEDDDDGEEGKENAEEEPPQESLKYARGRNSGYQICIQAGLADLAKKFGLNPEHFAENLRDNYQKHEVEQYPTDPVELAKEYTGHQFETPLDVLNGVRHLVAMQIAHDPLVRKCVRQVFRERAKINVKPTKRGRKEIDEHHACYSLKYLKDKPVGEFRNEEILKLTQAVDDDLLSMDIGIDSANHSYLDEIRGLFIRDEYSALVQAWNNQRSEALARALNMSLYPQLQKELKLKLTNEAKEGILKTCTQKLNSWLKVAPYRPMQEFEDDEDFDTSKGLRIMAIAYKPERDIAGFACVLDSDGEVTDFLRLPHIMQRKNPHNPSQNIEKEEELDKLKEFILDKKPHVIAIAGESREALDIQYDVGMILKHLEEDGKFAKISTELVDNAASVVYSVSKKAAQDYPEYPAILREAISVARRLREPLAELSQLCNADEDLACIYFHPMQEMISREQLLASLYLEFVNVTNEVGVDINKALAHPYLAGLLQFVCGLGPRKAAYVLKQVKAHSRLENRSQLVMHCHLGPKVFINCAGFIKIDTSSFGESTEEYTDVLDGSRVHPETYEWARKMAIDALEYDDTAEDANPAAALEEILESPERLRDLDLEAFSVELERQGYGQKLTTLYDIRAELNHRYKDQRTPYKSPDFVERFNMLTKETPATLFIGKLVLCRVTGIAKRKPAGQQLDEANPERSEETGMWVCPFCKKGDFAEISEVWSHFDAGSCLGTSVGVRVRLDNGLNGFIHTKNLSDKEVKDPGDRVKVGMAFHARILKVNIEKFQVDLTCKSSDLLDKEDRLRPTKDNFYDLEAELKDRQADEAKSKVKSRQSYVKRVIAHPSFHNVDYKECEKILDSLDMGECVIRPSSKGPNNLTLSWRLGPGIYSHVDIKEEGKQNAFSLGKTLYIGSEEFEDLDEIIARYLQPMVAHAREIQTYKYYVEDSMGGSRDVMEKRVFEEKKKAPTRIPYLLSTSKELPGKFMLSYMPRDRVVHEFTTVTHEGLRFRGQLFHSLLSLIKWFKEHFREPIPQRMVTPSHATPNINNLDPSLLRRAAGLPPKFPSANATPGATPSYSTSRSAYPNYPYSGSTPVMTPSLMTPSYQTSGQASMEALQMGYKSTTPRYGASPAQSVSQRGSTTPRTTFPTQRTNPGMGRPGTSLQIPGVMVPPTSGSATPRQSGGSTPRTAGLTPRPSESSSSSQSGLSTPRGASSSYSQNSRSGTTPRYTANRTNAEETDWAKMALIWAKEQKQKQRRQTGAETTPVYDDK